MAPRLDPPVPPHKYLCFYPMDKKRGEDRNWYTVPIDKRRDMMREHGMIGRRYTGRVKQIILGSIGFDDWEWGVDLFADDPLVFKQLIYEMRFDRGERDLCAVRTVLHQPPPEGIGARQSARIGQSIVRTKLMGPPR